MQLTHSRRPRIPSQLKVCLLALVTLLALGGCSWFDSDDDEIVPAKLIKIDPEVKLVTLWDYNLGKGAEDNAIKLIPAFSGSRVYGASADGNIFAINSGNGKVIWEVNVVDYYSKEERGVAFADGIDVITGGVGQGSNIVVVGSAAGELVAPP